MGGAPQVPRTRTATPSPELCQDPITQGSCLQIGLPGLRRPFPPRLPPGEVRFLAASKLSEEITAWNGGSGRGWILGSGLGLLALLTLDTASDELTRHSWHLVSIQTLPFWA